MGNFSGIGVSRRLDLFMFKPQLFGFGELFSKARHELEMELCDEVEQLQIDEQREADEDKEQAEDNESIVKGHRSLNK